MFIPRSRSLTDSILRMYQMKAGLCWASCPKSIRQVNPDWFLKLGLYKSIFEKSLLQVAQLVIIVRMRKIWTDIHDTTGAKVSNTPSCGSPRTHR
jgi:hypothetical protein